MTALHPTCCRLLDEELSSLLEIVLAGEAIGDRAIAERLVRFLGATISLREQHEVDRHGRCGRCAAPRWWSPWRRPHSCSVHSTLVFCLTQPFRFVRSAVLDRADGTLGERPLVDESRGSGQQR